MNPRVLSDNGLAIHRLTELGHLRFRGLRKSISFLKVFISTLIEWSSQPYLDGGESVAMRLLFGPIYYCIPHLFFM